MNTSNVLVVDDDPFMADICSKVLENAGYSVEVASNGGEALSILDEGADFGVVLLDAIMPVLDGVNVCWQIKADPRTKDTAVIIMSASEVRLEEGRACADGVIAKPFNLVDLLDIVGHVAVGHSAG